MSVFNHLMGYGDGKGGAEWAMTAMKGGRRWHSAVVCPGTRHNYRMAQYICFQPNPNGTHTHTHRVMPRFGFLTMTCRGHLLFCIITKIDNSRLHTDSCMTEIQLVFFCFCFFFPVTHFNQIVPKYKMTVVMHNIHHCWNWWFWGGLDEVFLDEQWKCGNRF